MHFAVNCQFYSAGGGDGSGCSGSGAGGSSCKKSNMFVFEQVTAVSSTPVPDLGVTTPINKPSLF